MIKITYTHKIIFFILTTFSTSLSYLGAQATTNSAGATSESSGGSVSYSVGQVLYTINKNTEGSFSNGVQQPFEITVISGFEEKVYLEISAYPNPFNDFLILKIGNFAEGEYLYKILDITGKVLDFGELLSNETRISMTQFPPSAYFFNVIKTEKNNSKQTTKTFIIIKH